MRRGQHNKEAAFSLVELLVTVTILAVLSAIAVPVYLNQKNKSSSSAAASDARAVANEVTSLLTQYSHLGTSGTISVAGTVLTVSLVSPTPAGNVTGTARLTPGSVLSGSTFPGAVGAAGARFCISVVNNGQTVVANETGIVSATSCAGGIAS